MKAAIGLLLFQKNTPNPARPRTQQREEYIPRAFLYITRATLLTFDFKLLAKFCPYSLPLILFSVIINIYEKNGCVGGA